MILYHGTGQKLGDIDFDRSRLRTDFGKGFYMSDKLGNARDWAVDRSSISETPTVMRYDVSNNLFKDENVSQLWFTSPTIEWLNFVRDNRRKTTDNDEVKEPRHSYDVVSGPIANDKVAIAVDKYCRSKLSAEEALKEIKAIKNVYQLSMHTHLALSYIQAVSFSQLYNKKWSDWVCMQ
jgi:hypothetical protein